MWILLDQQETTAIIKSVVYAVLSVLPTPPKAFQCPGFQAREVVSRLHN